MTSTILVVLVAAAGGLLGWLTSLWVHSVAEDPGTEMSVRVPPACPHCHHQLELGDVNPLRSLASGHPTCPNCQGNLAMSWLWYPVLCALIFGATAAVFGAVPALPAMCLLGLIGAAASTTDIRTMLIPARLAWGGLAAGAVALVVTTAIIALTAHRPLSDYAVNLKGAAIGAVGYFGLFFLLNAIRPAALGFGDVRLVAVLGLYLGWLSLNLVVWGILLGAIAGLIFGLAARVGGSGQKYFPYGPGLVAGTLLAVWFHAPLLGGLSA